MSRQDDVSKLSHFSKAITGSVGEKTHEKVDNEKQLQDISKRLKWEEAREKVSKVRVGIYTLYSILVNPKNMHL